MARCSALALALVALPLCAAAAAEEGGALAALTRPHLLASTIPADGDQNPYAVVVSPVTQGKLIAGHVLVDNFNARSNLQGTGGSIVSIDPATGALTDFATLPHRLAVCPGGVGLTAAMAVLKSGWVIVGSLPSSDGTTRTMAPGCLIVLDSSGHVAGTIAGPAIDGPWGNMAVIDQGGTATLFVSNTGFGVGAPGQAVVNRATVLRLRLEIAPGGKPVLRDQAVIADGLGEQADAGAFVVGPTGLALAANGTLYVSDAIGNRIVAIDDAATRTTSAGVGRELTADGLLKRPLALALTPAGTLLATNARNGEVVEIDPRTGRQLGARWLDTDRAQTPPGNGDLFGLAVTATGTLYYVQDDTNTLMVVR